MPAAIRRPPRRRGRFWRTAATPSTRCSPASSRRRSPNRCSARSAAAASYAGRARPRASPCSTTSSSRRPLQTPAGLTTSTSFPSMPTFGTGQPRSSTSASAAWRRRAQIKGLFAAHRDLARLPMTRLVEPAVRIARERLPAARDRCLRARRGRRHTASRAPIARRSTPRPTTCKLLGAGQVMVQHDLAETIEALAVEGEDYFHGGPLGDRLVAACREQGGLLIDEDLARYQVVRQATAHAQLSWRTDPDQSAAVVRRHPDRLRARPAGRARAARASLRLGRASGAAGQRHGLRPIGRGLKPGSKTRSTTARRAPPSACSIQACWRAMPARCAAIPTTLGARPISA